MTGTVVRVEREGTPTLAKRGKRALRIYENRQGINTREKMGGSIENGGSSLQIKGPRLA